MSEQRPPDQREPEVHDRTEPWVMALDETPVVGDAVKADPLVQEDLSEASVPLSARLRDRRTQASIIVPAIVLLLSVAGIYALMSFTVSRRTREIAIRRGGRISAAFGAFVRHHAAPA